MPKPAQLFYNRFDSPLGPLWMAAHTKGLSYLVRDKTESSFLEEMQGRAGALPQYQPAKLSHWHALLNRYFSGEKVAFEGPIHFLEGTPFQKNIWRTLTEIPYAEVRSYRWIGDRLSLPGAGRAIGNACGKNPIPILLPCHRVIRQNGSLGGYTGGLHIKKKLLEIEGHPQNSLLFSSSK